MKRRELLAAGGSMALAAIAGCSNSEGNGENDEDPGSSNDTSESDVASTTDDPTDEELAQEHIDEAQAALESALSELEAQGREDLESGTALDARVELTTAPIEDHLATTRTEIDEAREYDLTDEQAATVDGLETGEEILRNLVGNQPTLNEVATEVDYFLEDVETGDFDRAGDRAVDLTRAVESAKGSHQEVTEQAAAIEAEALADVEALSTEEIEAQLAVIESDLEAAAAIAEIHDPLAKGADVFWTAWNRVLEEEFDDVDIDALRSAEDDHYPAVRNAVDVEGDPAAFASDLEEIRCYAGAMKQASKSLGRTVRLHVNHRRYGSAAEDFEDAVDAVQNALECGLRDLDVDPGSAEYRRWVHSGPELEIDSETWLEGGTHYIDGAVENITPYRVEGTIYAVYYREEDGRTVYTDSVRLDLESGEVWEPENPWTISDDENEVADVGLEVNTLSWHYSSGPE